MELTSVLKRINSHYNQHLPFVLFSLPNEDSIKVSLQNDNILYDMESYSTEGFIFAPFDYTNKAICIPSDKGETITEAYPKKNIHHQEIDIKEDIKKKKKYIKCINNAIRVIKNRNAIKIVTSRKKKIELKQFDLIDLIIRILNLYPSAF